jgi:hypothetical protein
MSYEGCLVVTGHGLVSLQNALRVQLALPMMDKEYQQSTHARLTDYGGWQDLREHLLQKSGAGGEVRTLL